MRKILDLKSQRFGRLVAIYPTKKRNKENRVVWLCQCDCGNLAEVRGYCLSSGHTKSCGCLNAEKRKKRNINNNFGFKHGDAKPRKQSKLYHVWVAIKQRCLNLNNPNYKYYGGRGIKVCNEWRNSYQSFKEWALLSGYAEGLVIDRIDSNGNYEPSNCQWITASENSKKSWREKKRG